jgi:hypothetical protein
MKNQPTVSVNDRLISRRGDYYRAELSVPNTNAPVYLTVTNLAVRLNGSSAALVSNMTGNAFTPQTPESFYYDLDGNLTNDGQWNVPSGQMRNLRVAGMTKQKTMRGCLVVLCCSILTGGCDREKPEAYKLGEATVKQIGFETITNIHPVQVVVTHRFTKQVSLDEKMRARLKTTASSIWVGAIDLKSTDGAAFRIVTTDAGITEREFISELIVGKTYQLPDDFVASLQNRGWTNWIQAQIDGL